MKGQSRGRTKQGGQSLVELLTALTVVIPALLILIDCAVISIGAALNDSVCRDAARAAAAGPPSVISPDAPRQRAVTVIKHVYYSNLPMKVRDAVVISEAIRDIPPKFAGGNVDGDITVQTTIDIYPPFLARGIGSGFVILRSKHSVPVTYIRPASDS